MQGKAHGCEETVYGGTIFSAGGVFLSDFEVDADVDDYALPYANRTIAENILDAVKVELPVSTISEVRQAGNEGNRGDVYRVQGYVTSGTAIEENTFFDCIYIQDETGGLDIFPYSEGGLEIGTKIEIIGYLADYQGDLELKVMDYTILDEKPYVYEPELMSCADAMDYETNGGRLIKVQGTVKNGSLAYNSDGTLAQFVVLDENGNEAKVFIDGYIFSSVTGKNELASIVKEGSPVSAVGLLYMHPEGNSDESVAVLRVRDCAEIVLLSEDEDNDNSGNNTGNGSTGNNGNAGNGNTGDNGNNGNAGNGNNGDSVNGTASDNNGQVSADTTVDINENTGWDKVIDLFNTIADDGNITAVLHNSTIVPKEVINFARGKAGKRSSRWQDIY